MNFLNVDRNELNIFDKNKKLLLTIERSNPKYSAFVSSSNKTKSVRGLLFAALIPVRTNLKDVWVDFFCPNTAQALKIQNVALRIMMTFKFIILDACTLPVRFLTLIPRIIYNEYQTPAPLHDLLKKEGFSNLQSVYLKQITTKTLSYKSDGFEAAESYKEITMQAWAINLIETPKYPGDT